MRDRPVRQIRLALLGAVALFAGASSASAAQVAYVPNWPTGAIWLENDDGTNAHAIPNTVNGVSPTISPDGTKLAFIQTTDSNLAGPMYVMNLDGTSKRLIYTGFAEAPDWSPDGAWIAFGSGGVGQSENISVTRPDGTGGYVAVGWPGLQSDPAWFPDGGRLAFRSQTDPTGLIPLADTIFTSDLHGESPVQVTNGGGGSPDGMAANRPTVSKDGVLAFEGNTTAGLEGIFTANADGSNLRQITTETTPWHRQPDFSPDGQKVVYVLVPNFAPCAEIRTVPSSGGTSTSIGCGMTPDYPSYDASAQYTSLLYRYAPQLRYHEQELWRADAADEVTDSFVPGKNGHSNKLFSNARDRKGNPIVLASADPALQGPDLSLQYLAPTYPGGQTAVGPDLNGNGGDYLDETDQTLDDYRALHSLDKYFNRMYGRVARGADGRIWLQYWFFYYYNDGSTFLNLGAHETDWENIQIGLGANLQPELATYSQHGNTDQDTCTWDRVPKFLTAAGDSAPVVYVDKGTHANMFVGDSNYNNGDRFSPRLTDITNAPAWTAWPGRWGNSNELIRSPGQQGLRWTDPSTWANNGDSCPSGAIGGYPARVRRGPAAPRRATLPTPRIQTRLEGERVSVTYAIPRSKRLRGQKMEIWLTAQTPGRHTVGTGATFVTRRLVGTRSLRAPARVGSFVVRASVHLADRQTSRVSERPMRMK